MTGKTREEIAALADMTVAELRDKYAAVFGEPSHSRHKQHLRRRIAWRLQSIEEGVTLSERARQRAAELANEADLRLTPPKDFTPSAAPERTETRTIGNGHDTRLPMPGAVITREYKGRTLQVTVLDKGFEYDGRRFRSLSAIAREITGTNWNGYAFYGCAPKNYGGNDR